MQIKNVEKRYNNSYIFTNLNLNLPNKGLFLIKGDNGSGKTTLLNIIGRFTNYKGEVMNNSINEICTVFQDSYLLEGYTIKQHLKLFNIDIKYLKKVNMEDKIDAYPDELSNGQKQRIANLLALCSDRKLVLMDEPFANLDRKNRGIINKIINKEKQKKLIIIVSHDTSEFNNVDGIINVNNKDAKLSVVDKTNSDLVTKKIKSKKLKINVINKRKYFRIGLVLSLIPFLIFLSFNLINIYSNICQKDITYSPDYNKFYLKTCRKVIEGKFEINKCENPSNDQLENIDYFYNYDYLLGYLYKRNDLKVINNPNIKLKEGRYPQNEYEILANSEYRLQDQIYLESSIVLKDIKTNVNQTSFKVEVVGIYHDLQFKDDNNLYFDYGCLDKYFSDKSVKNYDILLKDFYNELEIDSYKYLSFNKVNLNGILSDGEKYEFYQSIESIIKKVKRLLKEIIIILTIYLGYHFFKLNRSILLDERKNIFYLIANSYNCFSIICKRIFFTIIPCLIITLLQFIFSLISNLSWSVLLQFSIVFTIILLILVVQTFYLHNRKKIGSIMRTQI